MCSTIVISPFRTNVQLYWFNPRLGESDESDDEGNQEFDRLIELVFGAMCKLLSRNQAYKEDSYILAEGACLKHIPSVIGDLILVYSPVRLSEHLVELVCNIPTGKLNTQKLQFITDIVHSELFLDPECRFMLLPIVTSNILQHLPGGSEVGLLSYSIFTFIL